MQKKNNIVTAVIGVLIALPLSLYANQQQELNAEAHRHDFKPVAVKVIEVQEVDIEEVIETVPEEPVEAVEAHESLGEFKLTAYCSCEKCCGKWAKNRPVDAEGNQIVIGSCGEVLVEGISVAVDKTVIPYGSELLINGQEYKAQDCGGAIKGNRIDVYFSSHRDALEFGVQYAEVFLKKGDENGT